MKKMSCFCASNTSGDTVYSGYLRWRMGIPLPPIPKEDVQALGNINKKIFDSIDGVKNVNDLTVDETGDEETLKRFRRRKRNDSPKCESDKISEDSNSSRSNKHFRENPLYLAGEFRNSTENVPNTVPLSTNESFISKTNSNKDITSSAFNILQINKENDDNPVSQQFIDSFFDNIPDYNEVFMAYTIQKENIINSNNPNQMKLQKAVDDIVAQLIDHSQARKLPILSSISPPPLPPPHQRKPSTIIEESESEARTSILSNDTINPIVDSLFCSSEYLRSSVSSNSTQIETEQLQDIKIDIHHKESTSTTETNQNDSNASIPIYSVKKNDINKIMSGEYDYAYNKNWSKGVEMNLSLNLSEDKRLKKKLKLSQLLSIESMSSSLTTVNTHNKENQLPGNVLELSVVTDEDVFMTDINTVSTIDSKGLPEISPVPAPFTLLKLSSIEADAVNSSSNTPLSINNNNNNNNNSLNESIENTDSISHNESWDVLQGQFVKELTAARFINPTSIINNNISPPLTSHYSKSPNPPRITSNSPSTTSSIFPLPPSQTSNPTAISSITNNNSTSTSNTTTFNKDFDYPNPFVFPGQYPPNIQHQYRLGNIPSTSVSALGSSNNINNNGNLFGDFARRNSENSKRYFVNINPNIPLDKQPWYHFYLTRSKAESLLHFYPDGSFLVRRSESNKNDYSLSIRHKSVYLHMKIAKSLRGFVLGEYSQPYQSIPHMLYHYCLTMVPVKGADAATLKYAISREQPGLTTSANITVIGSIN